MCTNSWGSEAPPQRTCVHKPLGGGPRPNPKGERMCTHSWGSEAAPRPPQRMCTHSWGTLGTRARAARKMLSVLGGLDGQFYEKTSTAVGDSLTPTHPQGCVQTAGGQWTHPKGPKDVHTLMGVSGPTPKYVHRLLGGPRHPTPAQKCHAIL